MKAPAVEWLIHAAGSDNACPIALKSRAVHWSSAELAAQTLRTAAVLRQQGVTQGSRIALVHGSDERYVTALLAVFALGATAVPLNPLYRTSELAFHFAANAIKGVIADPSLALLCRSAMAEAGRIGALWTTGPACCGVDLTPLIAAASTELEPADVQSTDVAVVFHTPGATGRSKLVPRTHGQLKAECDNVARSLGTSAEDVIFGALPLHHCHGMMNCLMASLRAGCSLILHTDPRPFVLIRKQVLAAIAAEKATIFPTISFQVEKLLAARGDYDLRALRLCFTGGSALKQKTFVEFQQRFGVAIRQQYGCTEIGAVTLNLGENPDATWMSVGRPLAGTTVTIAEPDEDGIGEIVVGSDALTAGYEGHEELNRRKFAHGCFRTGDLGYVDSHGNLNIVRRRPIYLDVAGHKVDAVEVVQTLQMHPLVLDVQVVDANTEPAAIKAIVTISAPLTSAQMREFCQDRLASYKVPSVFEFRETEPLRSLHEREAPL